MYNENNNESQRFSASNEIVFESSFSRQNNSHDMELEGLGQKEEATATLTQWFWFYLCSSVVNNDEITRYRHGGVLETII